MPRLLKKHVDSLKAGADGRDAFLWCSELRGFGVRAKPGGRKSFVIQYRNAEGVSRRMKVGDFGVLTLDQARTKAGKLLARVQNDEDPVQAKRDLKASPTFHELATRYMRDHCVGRCKPSTLAAHEWLLQKYLLPELGARRVAFVEPKDIQKLHEKLATTPYNANRALGLIKAIFNHAERWGVRPAGSNPTRHIKKYREQKRERFLTPKEFQRVLSAIDEGEKFKTILPEAARALRLLFFTGCRLSEILTLRWEQVDLVNRCLTFREHKTDSKGVKSIPLNDLAVAALSAVPPSQRSSYVHPGKKSGQHLVNLQKPWRRALKSAGIANVRIHDVRHTFASLGVSAGLSLPVIGGLLGHKSIQTTARYAHLSHDPLRAGSDLVGKALLSPVGVAPLDGTTE